MSGKKVLNTFPNVFKELDLGHTIIKNRVIMGSMHVGLEDGGTFRGLTRLADFYAARAKGGVGLIVTGGISPNRAGTVYPFASKMTNFLEARAHKEVTSAVHENGGKI